MSALHFNYNLRRDSKKDDKGRAKLKVVYPKFKGGEATVREMKVESNYGKKTLSYSLVQLPNISKVSKVYVFLVFFFVVF